MSRVRPYETFEKAFFNSLIKDEKTKTALYSLLGDMKHFEKTHDEHENVSMYLPWTYLVKNKEISMLWSCLSRLFGDQDPWVSECEIPIQYLSLAIDYVECRIQEIKEDDIYAS